MKSNTYELGVHGAAVVRNVRALRHDRGWSADELHHRTGVPRSIIANLENGRRAHITVDELAAFARAFYVEPWSLTTLTPVCVACQNDAPVGFACLTCGLPRRDQCAIETDLGEKS